MRWYKESPEILLSFFLPHCDRTSPAALLFSDSTIKMTQRVKYVPGSRTKVSKCTMVICTEQNSHFLSHRDRVNRYDYTVFSYRQLCWEAGSSLKEKKVGLSDRAAGSVAAAKTVLR